MAISLAGRMVVYAYALEYAFTSTSVDITKLIQECVKYLAKGAG